MIRFTDEQLLELKTKGIEARIECDEILREIHITFSKNNKHYKRIFTYEDYINNCFKSIITKAMVEAEVELNH